MSCKRALLMTHVHSTCPGVHEKPWGWERLGRLSAPGCVLCSPSDSCQQKRNPYPILQKKGLKIFFKNLKREKWVEKKPLLNKKVGSCFTFTCQIWPFFDKLCIIRGNLSDLYSYLHDSISAISCFQIITFVPVNKESSVISLPTRVAVL